MRFAQPSFAGSGQEIGFGYAELDPVIRPVSDFPQFEYSMKQVLRAGKELAGDLIWTDETAERIREVFAIANNWRDSHAFPMRKLRYELMGQMRRRKLQGITVARLKRMRSIRKKLGTLPVHLNQIQDLAGCRAIVPSIDDATALIGALRQNSAHILYHEDPFIERPKPDGYRSHHMVFKFRANNRGEDAHNGRRVEIQVRTRLQHSWATAVEAVGNFHGEDMKGGQGNPDWLRLFKLVSAELALAEGCPEGSDMPARDGRVREIIALDKKLDAAKELENIGHTVRFTEQYIFDPHSKPEYYLIKYDRAKKVVNVEPYFSPIVGVQSYDRAEFGDNTSGKNTITAVLVEADKIESLIEAYPNYFGDVQLFKTNLRDITRGKQAREYTMPPQETVAVPPKEKPDLAWFKRRKRWT